MKKLTYLKGLNKKDLRKNMFNLIDCDNIIGLPGPDVKEYIMKCLQAGMKKIELYENNRVTMMKQLPEILKMPVTFHFMDILNAPVRKNTLYDLDFCITINKVKAHVKKFRENFILTVSERSRGPKWWSVPIFLEVRQEQQLSSTQLSNNQLLVKTKQGNEFLFTFYQDTSRMLTIIKL